MLIALIDDGINYSFFTNLNVRHDIIIAESGDIKYRNFSGSILTEHGTTCARIIEQYALNAGFCSIRIFNKSILQASSSQLKRT